MVYIISPENRIRYSSLKLFLVNFVEISYLFTYKKNRNDQELGLILTGNLIEKGVIDKKVSLRNLFTKIDEEPTLTRNIHFIISRNYKIFTWWIFRVTWSDGYVNLLLLCFFQFPFYLC